MGIKKRSKGILLPPLVGYSFKALVQILKSNSISKKYYLRTFVIVFVNLTNLPFRVYERLFINPKFKNKELIKPPIFIIGHWRSGTTHLHNLLSKDPQMGYVTTYQSVYPNTLFNKLGKFIFKGFMKLMIPKKREGDNVILGPELPQEEEFTLGHRIPFSYYLFWIFPKKSAFFYDKYLKLEGINKDDLTQWKTELKLLITKACYNTNGLVFLSKNPPNTARIPILLELFPNAKFIHIHRNPIEVYVSTQNFFQKMMPHLQLQSISKNEINTSIISTYKKLMRDYLKNRSLISKGNLYELSFYQLEKDPIETLKSIYQKFDLDGFETAKISFIDYINSMSHYKKNKHYIYRNELDIILKEWKFAMNEFDYKISENIKIKEDE